MTEENQNKESQIQEETVSSLSEVVKEDISKKMDTTFDEEKTTNTETNENDMKVETSENGTTETPNGTTEEEEAKSENVSSTGTENTKENEPVKEDEKKKEDQANKKDESLGSTVAKHYNQIPAGSKEGRKDSRIFHLRNFNNWVKSVIINEFLDKVKRKKRTSDDINILDLACGKGGDLLKWDKGKVDHVIMADIAATSIDQCKERYSRLERDRKRGYSRDRVFTTEFFAADCTKEVLSEKYKKSDIKLDLTSCQFAFHYSFESYEQADIMLKNACENLRVGGYFIGTTADSNKLVKRIKECKEADSFGNSVFNIKSTNRDNFPLFGSKYMFYLEGVVDCPEFLVHLPTMETLAAKYNMKLVWKKNFHEIFKDYERAHSHLLTKMNALEVYPAPNNKTLTGVSESQYKAAHDFLEKKGCKQVGTLSADEWEVAGLYIAFAFEKIEEKSSTDNRKRHRDRSSEGSSKRSRKESAAEEVYEVKDEIYDAEADMEVTAATTSEAPKPTETAENKEASEESAEPQSTTETPEEVAQEKSEEPQAVEETTANDETVEQEPTTTE